MTKMLEETFGLSSLEDLVDNENQEVVQSDEAKKMAEALMNVDPGELANADYDVDGTVTHTLEADEIYEEAMKAYKDLLDHGFQIEPKHAGANAFSPAAKMLEIALKASQSKSAKKMEKIRMIMEKERHDKEMGKHETEGIIDGDAEGTIVANRNDLMEKIRKGEI